MTYYEYDKIGRNTAIADALGNRTTFFYNAKSQLESMTDPMGRTYTYSYDDNGNRIKTTYPNGTSVSSVYDARGRVTRQTDQHGYNTYYVYDGADRLVRVTNAQGVSTSYTYDEVGNMTSVTDGNGNVTAYAYDDFGRVIKTTNALGGSAYTTYNKSGNVLTYTDYAGNVTSYTYDSLDRVSSKTNNDGTVNYTYTADGKISSVTDSTGTTMFTYDLMDGLTRVDYPDGNYVSYSYDNACRLTSVTTPFGTTAYEYDLLDRLTRVIDRNGYATVYEYDANGNRTAVRYANGYTTTYDYDLLNRLIKQETVDIDGDIVVQYIYTLGAAGERKSVTELNRSVEYTYDSLYRLTSETITEGETTTIYTYSYDNVSNRILKTENGEETAYVYNALNQLVSDSETSYEYDLNGNLVRVIGSANSALYEYNSENRLVKATVQNGSLVIEESYTYDYHGNRTSKTTHRSDGVTEYVKYLNDNSSLTNVLAEIDENGTAKCTYTLGADLISQEREGKVYTYLYDGHGSVVGLVNESGNVTDTYCYDAFGNLLKSTGSTENCYRYCGEQFDSTTGLYYLRARYMDTATGRFISQDSYAGSIDDPVSLHKYLYANSSPTIYVDPSGNMGLLAEAIISVGIDVAFYGISSGLINVGLSLIHELRGVQPGEKVDFGSVILTSFTEGFLTGAFFGACGMLAASLSSAAIYCALGGSSVLFTLMSFGTAYAEGKAGNDDLATIYFIFGLGGIVSAKNCFNSAAACVAAKVTAGSTTSLSTSNKQTATAASGNNSPSDNVNTNTSGNNSGGNCPNYSGANDVTGNKNNQMNQPKNPGYQPVRNKSTSINNREYSGHALDRMQDRGIMSSVVENTIQSGISSPSKNNTMIYYDPINNVTVVLNDSGKVVTVRYGK